MIIKREGCEKIRCHSSSCNGSLALESSHIYHFPTLIKEQAGGDGRQSMKVWCLRGATEDMGNSGDTWALIQYKDDILPV